MTSIKGSRAFFKLLGFGLAMLASGPGAVSFAEELAGNGRFEFLLPLGSKCLSGAFPITLDTTSGTIALEVNTAGVVSGQLAVGGGTFKVTGKHTLRAGTDAAKMTARGADGLIKLIGTVQGEALTGTSDGGRTLPDLTGALSLDLSDAQAMTAEVTLDLTTDSHGRIAGSGTAAICGTVIPVTARGKSVNGAVSLTVRGAGFTFVGKGAASGDGFLLDWKGKSTGAISSGQALSIAPVSESDTTKEHVVLPLAALSFDPPSPSAGSTAAVTIDVPGATSISVSSAGQGCGGFGFIQQAGSHLTSARVVGEFGDCTLTVDVQTPSGVKRYETAFRVEPTDLLLPALEVLDGVFHPGDLPAETGSPDDPNITSLDAPGSLINGGAAEVRIHLADPGEAADVNTVFVKVQGATGFDGYYEVPAAHDGDAIVVTLRLAEELTAQSSEHARRRFATQLATDQEIIIKLRNRFGTIGTSAHRTFNVREVGAGEIKVSVSWNTPTDVDLHVVEPTGFEIYYGAATSPSGGSLDLDSNPGCGIDGVNNENIVWGTNAPAGEYVVRVDFYSDCDPPPKGAEYSVTVNACGDVSTVTGSFAPGSDDRGGRGSGVEVKRFTVGCGKKRVRGRATYEDFAQTDTGLASGSTMLPIRFAKVEVHRDSDGFILERGNTKQDGTFDLTFENHGTPGYYVLVRADQKNAIVNQYVVDKIERIYNVRSEGAIDETQTPDKTDLRVEAMAGGAGPAFNVFDVGIEGANVMRLVTGSTPPRLKWLWTKGAKGECGDVLSCYNRLKSRISVCSDPSDNDEYDDLVLLHEYGHFFQAWFARNDSRGGLHSSLLRSEPKLAWSEGSATFFGNFVRRSPVFLDTDASGIGIRRDIEDVDPVIPSGTDDSNQTGKISETIVSAILWDMVDTTTVPSDNGKDNLTDTNGVFGAMSYLGSSLFHDRGAAGADLVDFLDGWFCVGNGHQDKLEQIVFEIHTFDYDFMGPNGTCRGSAVNRRHPRR